MGVWFPVCLDCGEGREFKTPGVFWDRGTRCAVCGADLVFDKNGRTDANPAGIGEVNLIRAELYGLRPIKLD